MYVFLKKKAWQTFVTFAFLIGELVICQAKPSLLEVFHTKSFPSLCSLDHEPIVNRTMIVKIDQYYTDMHIYIYVYMFYMYLCI